MRRPRRACIAGFGLRNPATSQTKIQPLPLLYLANIPTTEKTRTLQGG